MGFLAVICVAAGFALDDPAMVAQPLLPLLESALTVIFVTEFVARMATSAGDGQVDRFVGQGTG
jgi:hypothetical protein